MAKHSGTSLSKINRVSKRPDRLPEWQNYFQEHFCGGRHDTVKVYNQVLSDAFMNGNIKKCVQTPGYTHELLKVNNNNKKNEMNMMGREKNGEQVKQLIIRSISHHLLSTVEAVLWHRHVWLPVELCQRCLTMMWLLIEAARWTVKCTGLCSLLRFSWTLQNRSDRASQCKWITKANSKKSFLKHKSGKSFKGQGSHLNST